MMAADAYPAGFADHYYQQLLLQTFSGCYEGTLTMSDKTWYKIRVLEVSVILKQLLTNLEENLEGIVWKGYHNGCFYIDQVEFIGCAAPAIYQIVNFHSFRSDNWRKVAEYSAQIGYYVTLKRVII